MFSVTQEIGTHLCFWFVCESACYELPEQNPICLPQGKHSYSKKCVKIRFWMGALCSGKLSVGQVIWAWKMKRNPAKCFTVLLTRCSSGSTYLPSELQQIPTYLCRGSFCLSLISEDYFIWLYSWFRGAGCVPAVPHSLKQPMSLPLFGHPFHVPGCDWKGPSPSRASLWRNHYFTNIFSMGFAGWESRVGLCSLIPCGEST